MWLGASDIQKEGTFVWETSKTVMTFSKWSSGQPDNSGNIENCVHFWLNSNVWNDLGCDAAVAAMCEVIFPCN
jgi:hypothetical protein